jgi:hypothetical protein
VVRRLLIVSAAMAVALSGCSRRPVETLKLERNLLTVTNNTADEWTGVEIWLNWYYRATAASIPAGGRLQVPLDAFVAGFGQRFDFYRAQIRDLRLKAKRPDGQPVEVVKAFEAPGLAGALGGKK